MMVIWIAFIWRNSMKTVILINLIVFLAFGFYFTYKGLNLFKLKSWLIGVYGFVTGMSFGYFRGDIFSAIKVGALFAFLVLFTSACSFYQRRIFREK
jgi:hypothetical protein